MNRIWPVAKAKIKAINGINHPHLAAFVLFVILACIYWYPLPFYFRTHQLEPQFIDPAYNQWIIGWGSHALREFPWRFFEANMFHPTDHILAYGDQLVALTLFAAPLIPFVGLLGAY